MTELDIRRRPVQARSAKTFDHILDTAIVVLEETGWDGFSTNLLAERAGIGIQTLYRYFPNKLSVVATLARAMIKEWESWFVDADIGWFGQSGVERFVERLKNQPGGVAIRQAMTASPVLRELDREDNRRYAERFAAQLVKRDDSVDYEDAVLTVLVAIEAALAVVDLNYDLPAAQAERVTKLCVEMQSTFLVSRFPTLASELA
ncbi:MAG: TetR/AcrR family transcriptional regulator [Pseudomonadota bacterium]